MLIGLDWEVEALNSRINARVKGMMEAGLLEEARTLWQSGQLGAAGSGGAGLQTVG